VDGNVFELAGKLTMHGITNPIVLQVTYLGMATAPDGRKQAVFDARTQVSRKEFEMSLNQVLELGGLLVSDRIDLTFDIHAAQSEMS
jgi:polyisoprenoid-binding protein YceI